MNTNSIAHASYKSCDSFGNTFGNSGNTFGNSWDTWAVARRLEELRYPTRPFTASAQLPSSGELSRLGVDLFVLEHELSQGLSAELFTRALALDVIDVDAFNNGPRYRDNAAEYYSAMASMVDLFEQRRARKTRRTGRFLFSEVPAINRSLAPLSEAV